MSVRVITGTAKGRRLQVPKVAGLRPTSDRARETLFNVLAPRLRAARVLDMFAGCGAVGIEALSRGAEAAVFVERAAAAIVVIEANLELCRLSAVASVVRADWRRGIDRLAAGEARFDIVFLDPPYDWDGAHTCVGAIHEAGLLAADGVAVIEHRRKRQPEEVEGFEVARRLDVGDTSFAILTLRGAASG